MVSEDYLRSIVEAVPPPDVDCRHGCSCSSR
jgi:hypothetical protein